jgi:hypothetical protein
MGVCPSHSALESYTYVEPPIIGPIQAANFGSLIPTESRRLSPEICCHDITELLATYLQEPPPSSTTGADLHYSLKTLCRRNFYVAFGTFVGI